MHINVPDDAGLRSGHRASGGLRSVCGHISFYPLLHAGHPDVDGRRGTAHVPETHHCVHSDHHAIPGHRFSVLLA